jgi:GT2 family glycosyltransferase
LYVGAGSGIVVLVRVATIIPVYNRADLIIEALETVRRQTRRPDHLVVVDDGSSDGTAEAVARWLRSSGIDCPATLERQANAGPGAARNHGVAAAGPCELLTFLDSDDLWPPDFVERAVTAMDASPDAVAASADRLNVDVATGRRQLLSWATMVRAPTRSMLMHGPPGTPNTALRAAAFHRLGGYDPALRSGSDYHLLLRISLLGPWLHLPGAPVTVRRGAASAAPHASTAPSDRRLSRARTMHRFLLEQGGAAALPERLWRRRLGGLWYHAGRQMLDQGRRAEARECFTQAIEIDPRHLRARLRRLAAGPAQA